MARLNVLLPLFATASMATPVGAQFPPDSFTNLQVLPKTVNQRELLGIMRGFTFALGVTCQFCHAGADETPLDSIDFSSDAKRTKRTARLMLQMVGAINRDYLSQVPDRPRPGVEVRCVSCHRGLARPVLVQDVLARALAEGGPDRAVAEYRALRNQFFGSGSYDFTDETLNEFGASLLRERRFTEALPLLALSAELHPKSMTSHFYLGEAHRSLGDTARAVASYRRALEIDPSQASIRRLLERLTPQRPPGRGPGKRKDLARATALHRIPATPPG